MTTKRKSVQRLGRKTPAKTRRTWRWVSRDDRPDGGPVVVLWGSHKKPLLNSYGLFYSSRSRTAVICAKDFFSTTGLQLKPGDCVKVEFSARIVDE